MDFKVVTWNIWFDAHCAETGRWQGLIDQAVAEDPDALCFQEVTNEFTAILEADPRIAEGYVTAEPRFQNLWGYDVAVYVKRRHRILATTEIAIPTALGRRCLAVDLMAQPAEGSTAKPCAVTVATVHLESMKYNAPKRAAQLKTILPKLRAGSHSSTAGEVAVLCGDFNMCASWDENAAVADAAGVTDTWGATRPGENGWTEDSAVNKMMFANKGKRKQVRFDRVLLVEREGGRAVHAVPAATGPPATRPGLAHGAAPAGAVATVTAVEVLGTDPVQPPRGVWKWQGRARWSLNEQVWASDHFGVRASLALHGVVENQAS